MKVLEQVELKRRLANSSLISDNTGSKLFIYEYNTGKRGFQKHLHDRD